MIRSFRDTWTWTQMLLVPVSLRQLLATRSATRCTDQEKTRLRYIPHDLPELIRHIRVRLS